MQEASAAMFVDLCNTMVAYRSRWLLYISQLFGLERKILGFGFGESWDWLHAPRILHPDFAT